MKFSFRLSQTKSARALQPVSPELRKKLNQSARQVVNAEIPDLKSFSLGVVFMSDEELLDLNNSSLGHDWYTDIITFEIDRSLTTLEAELYISVTRAQENAQQASVPMETELNLLIIHGLLHLAGYDDHDPVQKKRMRRRERFFLAMGKNPT